MFEYGFIMAGGEGKRLRPLTSVMPKPLLPIGERPIIELLIENMKNSGIKKIFISVNYKKEIIKNFLRDGSKYGVKIEYVEEATQTGTAGSLILLPEHFNKPLIVSNGDLVCNLDYKIIFDMLQKYDLVLTGIEKTFYIDFGVLHIKEDKLESWEEKPNIKYIINGGIYGISPEVIKIIKNTFKSEQYLDMPSLWELVSKNGLKIGVYLHNGDWKDIGKIEDYLSLAEEKEKLQ